MYDARGPASSNDGGMLFGLIALVVVGAAFALAWFGAGLFGKDKQSGAGALPTASAGLDPKLAWAAGSPHEARYLLALQQLDPAAYKTLSDGYKIDGPREAQLELLGTAGAMAVARNLDLFGKLAEEDINAMIDASSQALAQARNARSPLCLGATYSRLQNKSKSQIEREMKALGFGSAEMLEASLAMQADFLEMLVRTRRAPQNHGKVTAQDEAAMQAMAMRLMSDPTVMQLAMTNRQDMSAIDSVNLCEMGERLLREVRALPDGTKARMLSSAMNMPEVRDALRQVQLTGL